MILHKNWMLKILIAINIYFLTFYCTTLCLNFYTLPLQGKFFSNVHYSILHGAKKENSQVRLFTVKKVHESLNKVQAIPQGKAGVLHKVQCFLNFLMQW